MKIDKEDLLKYLNKRADKYRSLIADDESYSFATSNFNIRLNELTETISLIEAGNFDEITKSIDLDRYYDSVEEQYRCLHKALLNAIEHDEFTNIKSITEAIMITSKELKCVRERTVANER